MKRIIAMFFVGLMIFSGCQNKSENTSIKLKPKPVYVIEAKKEIHPILIEYLGIVNPQEIVKYSFKSSAVIEEIFVEKGQYVKEGEKLISLNTEDLEFSLCAAKANMEAVYANLLKSQNGVTAEEKKQTEALVNKAKLNYEHSLELYQKYKKLYDEDVISNQELLNMELKLKASEEEYKIAKEKNEQVNIGARTETIDILRAQYEQAKIDYEYKRSLLDDATIYAKTSGYIVEIINKPGEMAIVGYPVIAVRSENKIINVGLTEKDVSSIQINEKVDIEINGVIEQGYINTIDHLPDSQSRTYNVEIALQANEFQIGSIAKVEFKVGEEEGIYLPITSILNDGEDYIYIVKQDIATKKKITKRNVIGDRVKVEDIDSRELVIVEGLKQLQDGMLVIIEKKVGGKKQ